MGTAGVIGDAGNQKQKFWFEVLSQANFGGGSDRLNAVVAKHVFTGNQKSQNEFN
jgi:hypothetical protein